MDSDSEKLQPDISNVSRVGKMSRLCDTADLCEMSTQTSQHTHSQPSTPVGSHLEGLASDHALRKSSLTLPLLNEKEDAGGGISCNSTPASDTFYTATSVLSPDVRDLTSPWSPMPLEGSNSGMDKEKCESLKMAYGAFAEDISDDLPIKVPEEDEVIEENLSHFERDDDLSSSVYKSPCTSITDTASPDIIANSDIASGETQSAESTGKDKVGACENSGLVDESNLVGLTTSPIPQGSDRFHPLNSPGADLAATSTPVKAKNPSVKRDLCYNTKLQIGDNISQNLSASAPCDTNLNEFARAFSSSAYVENSSNPYSESSTCNLEANANNNIRTIGNGNNEVCELVSGAENSRLSCEDSDSSPWHSGLEGVSKRSTLISPHAEVAKANEVLLRLRENADKSDASINEQIQELEALKQHYANLEDQLISHPSVINKNSEDKTSVSSNMGAGLQEKQGGDRPSDLPLESSLLQEDRLALLIEREVQRRVLEEVVARENASLCSRPQYRRTYRSMSASVEPWSLGVRVLSPSEMRPYTSLSAGYEMEGEGGIHLYQSAASADDLLLTPGPLQSPMTDYDMSCGVCVCIPGYEMRGSGSSAHWEYEVKLAAGPDSWTVFRRYRRFRELHMYMCHKYGQPVEDLYFPPRRLFGNFSERVVAERRGQLEIYLQQLIVLCSELEESPLCGAPPCRATLAHFSPFFQRGVFETSRHTTS
ncbi:hypothetical protein SK128_016700 [Halocaridina rubra]|uniref:PX domain-containing protein n=1 Tax=Halocaridina rubra TaxID=373956 RepID=A0AAN8X759_HALRR